MKKAIKILAVIFVMVLIAGYFVIQWALQPEKIRRMVKESIQGVWNGPVEVGKASVNIIPPSVALSNLKLSSPENKELISLKALQIVPSLSEIFSGKVVISSINLVDPMISLETSPKGELLIKNCIKKTKESSKDVPENKKPDVSGEAGADSYISEVKINSIKVVRLFLNLPSEGRKTPLAVGPVNAALGLSLAPVLKVSGIVDIDPMNLEMTSLSINTGKVTAEITVEGTESKIKINVNESSIKEATVGTILAGPVHGKIEIDKTGKIITKDFVIIVPPKGTVAVNCTVTPSPASKVTAEIDCSNIETAKILKNVLTALKLTPKGINSLTIKSLKGTILKEKDKPLALNKFTGKMGDNSTIALSGYGASGTDYKLFATLNSYSIYSLLEGILKDYEFGAPIEKLTLAKAKVVITPKNITLPLVNVTMDKGTAVSGKVVINLPKEPGKTHFASSSVLNVKIDGDSLFSMLKLKPDSQLTGTLGGSINLSGIVSNPSAKGILKSPLLKYVYTGAPSVPVKNVIVKLSLKDLKGKVDELTGDFFGGKIKGSAECNLKLTPFTYTWKLDTIKLQMSEMVKEIPMLKDHITGSLSLSLNGTGKGAENETESLLSKLTLDGTLKSLETKILDSKGLIIPALGSGTIAKMVGGELEKLLTSPKLKDFDLETLTSSVHIKDGSLIFNDIDSTGMVGLKSDSIAINGDNTGLKGTFAVTVPKSEKETITLPIKLKGSLLKPDISIDPAALKDYFTKEKINEVKKKVEDKLNKALGGKAGNLLKGLFN